MFSRDPNNQNENVEAIRKEISNLLSLIAEKEQKILELENATQRASGLCVKRDSVEIREELTNSDIARYSRQLILPEFGRSAQLKLRSSSILIVGLGGLGCPAAQYLAAAGCGCLGLVDYDEVEKNNLHRQTLHTEAKCGMPKADSARKALLEINPYCKINTYYVLINSENAKQLMESYDVILDCSDNVVTRYLLNDACVLLKKPLVSGSALQFDGQLTVYNWNEETPCYRCLFPRPPPPEAVTNCGDGGVLGAVTGTIGSLQALEAIKIVTGSGEVLASRLLIFDGLRCTFRNIKLRPRRQDCHICSAAPIITQLIDYEQFCGSRASDKGASLQILEEDERITATDYQNMLQTKQPHLLIDVRQPTEFDICRLPGSINVPLKTVLMDKFDEELLNRLKDGQLPVVVLCRRGNDSQIAVQHMRQKFPMHLIRDIVGGLYSWHDIIDSTFPVY